MLDCVGYMRGQCCYQDMSKIGARNFLTSKTSQTGSSAQSAPVRWPMGLLPWGGGWNGQGMTLGITPYLMMKLGMHGAIPPLPNASSWREKRRLCPDYIAIYVKGQSLIMSVCLPFAFNFHCSMLKVSLTLSSLPVTWCTTGLTFNNCTLCLYCMYVFCVYLRKNCDFCHLQHKLIGFYNPEEKCLQRGTDWGFK